MNHDNDNMKKEYDFSGGIRGKYARRMKAKNDDLRPEYPADLISQGIRANTRRDIANARTS